jgi:hypothetical protein
VSFEDGRRVRGLAPLRLFEKNDDSSYVVRKQRYDA